MSFLHPHEGGGDTPSYRGCAYVVFEDLPLGPYGNRPPQLSFEVFRRPKGDGLEEKLEGVCLIPGAGEFVLATEAVMRREGLYSSALSDWRQQRDAGAFAGLKPVARGPKTAPPNPLAADHARLQRDNKRLTQRLERAEAIIDLQKKVAALLGLPIVSDDGS